MQSTNNKVLVPINSKTVQDIGEFKQNKILCLILNKKIDWYHLSQTLTRCNLLCLRGTFDAESEFCICFLEARAVPAVSAAVGLEIRVSQ